MTRLWPCLALVLVLMPSAVVAASSDAGPGVLVPLPPASVGTPPPGVRACRIEFEGSSAVATDCPRPCYGEDWDGPVLLASNECERTIWVTHLFQMPDGHFFRTPCFELPAGSTLAIPEAALVHAVRREPLVGITPGFGWPETGFRLDCFPARTPVAVPNWWIDDRWDAHVHDGVLGEDAQRPAPSEGD